MKVLSITNSNLSRNTNLTQRNENNIKNTISFWVSFKKQSFDTLYSDINKTTSIFKNTIKEITEPKVDGRKFYLNTVPNVIELETPERINKAGETSSIRYVRNINKNPDSILFLTSTKNNKTDYINIRTNTNKIENGKNIEIKYQKADWFDNKGKKTNISPLHTEKVTLTKETNYVTPEANKIINTIKEILKAFIKKENN